MTALSSHPIERWPALHLEDWHPTYETLHRMTQIVGKTRLHLAPFQNHYWHAALSLTTRGLTTGVMPFARGYVEVSFDFFDDLLEVRTDAGEWLQMRLEPKPVAAFYREYRILLADLGIDVHLVAKPNELVDATPFAHDMAHAAYDGDAVRRWFAMTLQADHALKRFRSAFRGKCSPSQFWWGGFDLGCTRYSGRPAPAYTGTVPNCPAYVMTESYSHECISAGFWPGSAGTPVSEPAFYAFVYPEPPGCSAATIGPDGASWHPELREWILPYEAVRHAGNPQGMIDQFLESTYEAAAGLAHWNVNALEARGAHVQRSARE